MYEKNGIKLVFFNKDMIWDHKKEGMANYFTWFQDQEVTKYNSHGLLPEKNKDYNAFFDEIENSDSLIVFAIIDIKTNTHIGNISLQSIDWINRSAEFAIVIGEKDFWGKGVASSAAEILFYHAFSKLNLNRIWSGTAATNLGMLGVFRKLNMCMEGVFREAVYLRGKYEDVHEYGILRKEYYENKEK